MSGEAIQVLSYSGYRGEESPRAFLLKGERIEVVGVRSMWTMEDPERKRRRYFKLDGSNGAAYTLFYDEECGEWFLEK
jgi:hypothetical protein